jgi:plasmid stabilization system protein ParE
VSYKLTKKAEGDLAALIDFSLERFGSATVRRWPVPPHWIYYLRAAGELRVLRIYHGAREPL